MLLLLPVTLTYSKYHIVYSGEPTYYVHVDGPGAAQPHSLYEHYQLLSSDGKFIRGLATT